MLRMPPGPTAGRRPERLLHPKPARAQQKEITMNKTQLIDAVAEHSELPKTVVAKVLSATFDLVPLAVAAGDPVTIPGFGTFETVERAERTGRNPQTGAELRIPASRAPKFRPGSTFKGLVADSKSPVAAS